MRRILLLLLIIISMSACKKGVDDTPPENESPGVAGTVTNCSTDSIYQSFRTAVRDGHGTEWINEHGNLLCEGDLKICVEQSHRIRDIDFNRFVNDHTANAQGPKYYHKTWQEIDNLISDVECYEKYLKFSIRQNRLEMSLNSFSTNYTSYSAVFLRQLRATHNLSPTDTISLIQAMVPIGSGTTTKESIIFKIGKSTSNQYYDLSDFPGTVPHYVVNPS